MFDFTPPLAAQSLKVVERLQQAGYVAYFAGGCVRDAMLGKQPKDFDVATDAMPETVRTLFGHRRTLAFGASFGVIGVLGDAAVPTEVATFRSDGIYTDGRRPDSVRFGTAEHDALRRDFTINGMFFDPLSNRLIDYVGGEDDLRDQTIRAIGDPQRRIQEDKLRMLRAVRFAASLRFKLDSLTEEVIRDQSESVRVVSGERIGAEMRRMWFGPTTTDAINLLQRTRMMHALWPEAAELLDDSTRLELVLPFIQRAAEHSFELTIASMIVGLSLPASENISRLTSHWKLSCNECRVIERCVADYSTLLTAESSPWSLLQPILTSQDGVSIAKLAEAWSYSPPLPNTGERDASMARAQRSVQKINACLAWPSERLDPPRLITGDVLREQGFRPGPKFGTALQTIRDKQLDGEISTIDEALAIAEAILK